MAKRSSRADGSADDDASAAALAKRGSENGDALPGHIAQIVSFLERTTREPDEFGDEARAVRIVNVSTDHRTEKRLNTYPVRRTANLRDLAEALYATAENYANVRADRCQFEIRVYYGTRDTTETYHFFAIEGNRPEAAPWEEIGGEITEATSGKGVLAMMMRFVSTDRAASIRERADVNAGYAENMRSQRLQLEEARASLESERAARRDLESRHLQTVDLLQTLLDRQQEREMAMIAALKAEERQDKLVNVAAPLIPFAINKIVGTPILPTGNLDLFQETFLRIVESLEDKHFEKLFTALGDEPHILMPMMQLIKQGGEMVKLRRAKEKVETERIREKAKSASAEERARAASNASDAGAKKGTESGSGPNGAAS